MFKIFGGKSSSKSKKEKENSHPSDKNLPPDLTPEERKEAEKLPFGGNTRLSKSRSGRYKVKNKQRTALDNDMYGTAGSVSASGIGSSSSSSSAQGGGAAGSSRSTGASGGSYINSSNSQSGSSSFSGQQGSLGRSSGGHCGVANSVTKRYPGATATTGISSQPTAV